jgi:hypothetical protein
LEQTSEEVAKMQRMESGGEAKETARAKAL